MKKTQVFAAVMATMVAFSGLYAAEKAPAQPAKAVKKVKKARKNPLAGLSVDQQITKATTPVQSKRHAKRHAEKKALAAANPAKYKILMLGDSITHQWEYKPAEEAYKKYIAPYPVLNLGCGGDRTQHTLWIVEKSGILDLIKPQLITLMIGTNNARYDYRATTAGIKKILDNLRQRYPEAKILLYAIFPRGADNKNPLRRMNEKVNAEIVKFCDGKNIEWVDIRKDFLTPAGVLEKSVMPDLLHPRHLKGYTPWGESLKPYFEKYSK